MLLTSLVASPSVRSFRRSFTSRLPFQDLYRGGILLACWFDASFYSVRAESGVYFVLTHPSAAASTPSGPGLDEVVQSSHGVYQAPGVPWRLNLQLRPLCSKIDRKSIMGIPPFWQTVDAVETGKTQSIAEWATHHFQSTGKPLRIAIDQPNWWYKSLPDDEEAKIKRSKSILLHSFRTRMTSDSFTDSPGSHPREKRFLERICYLLARNVQLVFVFDGPNKDKPARGGRVGAGNPLKVKLLRTMLDYLGVPRHTAPGDAEAECAKL